MKILTKQNMLDYVTGATILGCGGGGEAERGITRIEDAIEKGCEFKLVDLSELEDDDILCIVTGVGGGVSQEIKDKVAPYHDMFQKGENSRLVRYSKAAKELSDYIGKEITSFIASEAGGGNGVLPMYLNAIMGKPSVDADCCGRAKPQGGISLTAIAEIPTTPLSMVTPFMETLILKNAVDDLRAEDITRSVAVASGGEVSQVRCPAKVKDYRRGTAQKIVTRCIKIGEAIREAKEKGKNVRDEFVNASGAIQVFEGKVISFTMEGKGGFNWGDWIIEGTGKNTDNKMRVWFKNENLISWIDDEPYIMCPDLICILESECFEPLSNFRPDGEHNGRKVLVYGIRAIDAWRTPAGLDIFTPKIFGFDIEYNPL